MTETKPSVSATLTLSLASASSINELLPLTFSLLRQSDVEIFSLDLAFRGEDATIETDEGRIEIMCERRESGRRSVRIRCDALVRGSRETARQLCYQLSRRIAARDQVETIYWHPTRQFLSPADFRWGALRDIPQRFVGPRTIFTSYPGPSSLA